MIIEGLVTLKQGNQELRLQNHLTANAAQFLFRIIMGKDVSKYVSTYYSNNNLFIYLMRTFQIRLGIGNTQVPSHNLTALQSEKVTLVGNSDAISGDYDVAAPYDKIYVAHVSATDICSGILGKTIANTFSDGIDFVSAPPNSPDENDTYIVGESATGAFQDHEDEIAIWNGSNWDFTVPDTTYAMYLSELKQAYHWDEDSWEEIPKIREMGLFTYGYNDQNQYQWVYNSNIGDSRVDRKGNVFWLAAYISANGDTPDFDEDDINVCKPLAVEWILRISFAGDQ